MATRTFPPDIDVVGGQEMWPQLDAWVKTARPGDVMEAPDDARLRCDKPLLFPHLDVVWHWNGALFLQSSIRPYGAQRNDCVISNGNQVCTATPLPVSVNYGYVDGPGIIRGTHCQFLPGSRTVMKLDRPAVNGSGLPVTFTSKDDRSRCGFRITGRDFEHHDFGWRGPVADPVFTPFTLEAQHGVDLAGAQDGLIKGADVRNMFGDVHYLGADGARLTTGVDFEDGQGINCARSGIVPVKCADIAVRRYTFDQVGRTPVDIEPPAGGTLDNFACTDSVFGTHGLTLLSSGGHVDAHVGRVEFSRNRTTRRQMILWLVVGKANNFRGPYVIVDNENTAAKPHGGTYPTSALICIEKSRGATVTGNRGIVLQERSPQMAVVRSRNNSGPIVVHGNEQIGGIEVGPWIAA